MHELRLVGGSVLTPNGVVVTDIAVSNGVVVAVGVEVGAAERTIECKGTWVGPGFVDVHTHLREPGQEWKEDIASGAAAAAAGGFTAVVAMPNTSPAVDTPELAHFVRDEGRRVGLVEVSAAGCLTEGRQGTRVADIEGMWHAGVRMFSDDGDSVANPAVLQAAMESVASLGGVVSQHAVDGALSSSGHLHEGEVSSRLGLEGISREADDTTIARDIGLARLTGARYHVQHISTAGGVQLVALAKSEGLAVTAEATPHHLMFTQEDVGSTDTRYKMMPPLREHSDREALVEGLKSGTIDMVATDHAPHADTEKDVRFEQAANGVTGLEWSAAVVNDVASLTQDTFFDRMSVSPARLGSFDSHGLPVAVGNAANLVVFDPNEIWTPVASLSKSLNSPYLGRSLRGRVKATVLNGKLSHESER